MELEAIADQLVRAATTARATGPMRDHLADRYDFGRGATVAVNFQLAIVVTALRGCESRGLATRALRVAAESELQGSLTAQPFSYFERDALPPDFDTAAAVVSALPTRRLTHAFLDAVQRCTRADGLVPTWFDVPPASKYPVDPVNVHIEVQLAVLHARLLLGRRVCLDDVAESVRTCGLVPFWYYAPAYPRFLAALLLRRAGLNTTNGTGAAVRSWIAAADAEFADATPHAVAAVTAVRSTVNATNQILSALTRRLLNVRGAPQDDALTAKAVSEPVYWTVGFRPFMNRLFALAFLANAVLNVVEVEASR